MCIFQEHQCADKTIINSLVKTVFFSSYIENFTTRPRRCRTTWYPRSLPPATPSSASPSDTSSMMPWTWWYTTGESRGVQNLHQNPKIRIFKKQPKIVVMLPQCTPKLFLFIRKVSVTGVIIEPFPYKEIKHSNLLQTGLLVAIPDICQPRRGCKKFQVRGFFSYWTRKGF